MNILIVFALSVIVLFVVMYVYERNKYLGEFLAVIANLAYILYLAFYTHVNR